jgi:hypothetical protein
MGCLCAGKDAPHFTLCRTLGPSKCECRTADGAQLCTQPLNNNNDVCITGEFGNSSTARVDGPCDGYARHYVNGQVQTTRTSGTLANCDVCDGNDVQVYLGAEGTPCVGYLHDRSRQAGTVSCDNLRSRCNIGEVEACADLGARHH